MKGLLGNSYVTMTVFLLAVCVVIGVANGAALTDVARLFVILVAFFCTLRIFAQIGGWLGRRLAKVSGLTTQDDQNRASNAGSVFAFLFFPSVVTVVFEDYLRQFVNLGELPNLFVMFALALVLAGFVLLITSEKMD